jgi:hypothetical protein
VFTLTLPSFDPSWTYGAKDKPRVLILVVMDRLGKNEGPVAHIAVEREHGCQIDPEAAGAGPDAVVGATLTLHYRVIGAGDTQGGTFTGCYCAISNVISLSSLSTLPGAIFLDPDSIQGQRIGTYLMNEIVSWAKQWPQAMVNSITLNASQGDFENKDRRNRFYEQFNLCFAYTDASKVAGVSQSIPAGQLVTVDTWQQNITEVPVHMFISQLLEMNHRFDLDKAIWKNTFKTMQAEQDAADRSPILWGIRRWCSNHAHWLFVTAISCVVALTVYANFK